MKCDKCGEELKNMWSTGDGYFCTKCYIIKTAKEDNIKLSEITEPEKTLRDEIAIEAMKSLIIADNYTDTDNLIHKSFKISDKFMKRWSE